MELPKQKKLYSDLETRFTDLESLINELKKKKLTGLLKLTFDACEGIIFFDKGSITDGFEIFRGEMPVRDRRGRNIIERSRIEQGKIDVYELPKEILQIFVMTLREKPTQRLHTMYTDFRKLLIFLEQQKMYGTLEVKTSQGKGYWRIFNYEPNLYESGKHRKSWNAGDRRANHQSSRALFGYI